MLPRQIRLNLAMSLMRRIFVCLRPIRHGSIYYQPAGNGTKMNEESNFVRFLNESLALFFNSSASTEVPYAHIFIHRASSSNFVRFLNESLALFFNSSASTEVPYAHIFIHRASSSNFVRFLNESLALFFNSSASTEVPYAHIFIHRASSTQYMRVDKWTKTWTIHRFATLFTSRRIKPQQLVKIIYGLTRKNILLLREQQAGKGGNEEGNVDGGRFVQLLIARTVAVACRDKSLARLSLII
ncbi:hypothetical protein POTOM_050948 [Populus tomentosa]|uniref:Uncharacterized protein n=1 Tax=Populus tomentosa TaxID=118781 RepID=A0A8X7Y4M8_POPTO|nr:hypothetical protein POTOM_050948 [Populus tomentosa]